VAILCRPRAPRRVGVFVLPAVLLLAVSPARANIFSDFLDVVEDYGSRGWGAISSTLVSAGEAVGDVIVDDVGRPVAYQVASGVVPVARAVVNGKALEFVAEGAEGAYTGAVIHVRHLGETVAEGTVEIGTIAVDQTGELTCQMANAVVDGVTYAYENGMIVVANLAGLSCGKIFDLVAPDVDFTGGDPAVAAGNCGANIGVGFACAAPSGVMDLMSASEGMYREILSQAYKSPCDRVPIPPANLVCGTVKRSVGQVTALASCVMKLQKVMPPRRFGASDCRNIGEILFGVLLDVATDGADTAAVLRRVALAVMDIYQASMDVNDVTKMITSVCDGLVGQIAPAAAPPATGVTLYADKDYGGASLAVTGHLPTLGALDNNVSSIQLGDGITVAVYSEAHYQGVCDTLGGSVNRMYFTNIGNDHASSIRVGEACPARPAIRLYKDASSKGRHVEIGTDVPDLGGIGFNDAASSAVLLGDVPVALYSEPFYGGTCVELRPGGTTSIPAFSATLMGNDRVSSVRVGMHCDPVTAIFYADSNYNSSPTQVAGDVLDARGTPYASASSVNVLNANRPMSVYKEPNFQGECLDLPASRASFPSGWNDAIRSIRINASCAGRNATFGSSALVTEGNRCLGTRPQTPAERDLCYAACAVGGAVATCRANCDQRETLQAEPCTGEPDQRFTMRGAFLKNYAGKCVHTMVSQLALEGGLVSVAPCNDLVSGQTQSYYVRDSRLVNSQGRCLAVRAANLFDDTAPVVVHACDGSAGERFTTTSATPTMQYAPARPASPRAPALSCDFDVGAGGKLTCQSGVEALSFDRPPVLAVQATAARLPFDGALAFNGSTPLAIPARDTHDPSDGSYTVSFWFNPTSTTAEQFLLSHGEVSDADPGLSVRIENGAVRWRVADPNRAHVAELVGPLTGAGRWHHFVGVIDRDAQVLRAWLDGDASGFRDASNPAAATADVTALGPIDPSTPTYVGGAGGHPALTGSIDALRVYRRAVTAAEIALLGAGR
jgi:hypothetical protein